MNTCQTCQHYLPSKDAGQRAFLDGYGYCKAAPTHEQRSMFFQDASPCWLIPVRYQQRRES